MKEETAKKWILLANGDLKTAQDEFKSENPVTNSVCFHAQQCVEKYLKAYLTLHNQPFRKTHDIAELIELCKKVDGNFDSLYDLRAHKMTRYAVEVRCSAPHFCGHFFGFQFVELYTTLLNCSM